MKGFGHVGQGGLFSSSSNLSPLAPPFTVDPSHPRPATNCFGHVIEPCVGETPPYGYTVTHDYWLHPSSSVDTSFPRSNPNGATGLPSRSAASYDQVTSNLFGPQSVSESYFPQYPSTATLDTSTTNGMKGQGGILAKSGPPPLAPISGLWSGMSGSEKWRREDISLAVPAADSTLPSQGSPAEDELPACEEHPGVWFGKAVESLSTKSQLRPKGTDLLNSKSSSSEENTLPIPFNMPRTLKVPYPQTPSSDFFMEPWTQNIPSTNSSEAHSTEPRPYTSDPLLFYPSTAYSHTYSLTANGSSCTPFSEAAFSNNVNAVEQPRGAWHSKEGSTGQGPSTTYFQDGELYSDMRQIYNTVDGYYHVTLESSPVERDVSSNHPITGDYLNHFHKAEDKLLHNTTLAPSLAVGGASGESSSEMLDQFNPGVDSPCWRGASGSSHGLSGVTESLSQPPASKSKECKESSDQGHRILPLSYQAVTASSPRLNTNFVYHEMGSALEVSCTSPKRSSLVASLSSADNSYANAGLDCSKSFVHDNSKTSSNLEVPTASKSEPDESSVLTMKQLGSHCKVTDSHVDAKIPAYVGSFRMSDCSMEHPSMFPCSGGSPTNQSGPASDASVESRLPGLDIQLPIKVMHNLSELLLSCCSKDVSEMKEQHHEVIQNVINNLNACISLKVGTMGPVAGLHKGNNTAGMSHTSNNQVDDIHGRCEIENSCNRKKSSTTLSRKQEKFLHTSSPSNVVDFEQDDHMIQAIKKVLEENFDEEELHPQASLYKNLWLETEAALCSMRCKARFTAMKIKMQYKQCQLKGTRVDSEKLQSSRTFEDFKVDDRVASKPEESRKVSSDQGTSQLSSVSNDTAEKLQSSKVSEDFEADEMVVSKPRESMKPVITDEGTRHSSCISDRSVCPSILARFRILKSRIENSVSVKEQQLPVSTDLGANLGNEKAFCMQYKGVAQNISTTPQLAKVVDLGFAKRRNPWPFIRVASEDKCLEVDNVTDVEDYALNLSQGRSDSDESVTKNPQQSKYFKAFVGYASDDPLIESAATAKVPGNEIQAGPGVSSSSSSDWEHILKEAAWQT